MERFMIYIKKIHKFFLCALALFMATRAQASLFETVTQSIWNNKIATFMSVSTVIVGFIGYTLWQKNKRLNHDLDRASALIKQVLEEEKLREERFIEASMSQTEVQLLKTRKPDKKSRRRTTSLLAAYQNYLNVVNTN
jgi:amino acid permease